MSGEQQRLSPAEANAIYNQRESWCAVESKKEQSWCRKERMHSDEILKSSVFDIQTPVNEPRCTFTVSAPTHKERKHFRQQCKLIYLCCFILHQSLKKLQQIISLLCRVVEPKLVVIFDYYNYIRHKTI